MPFPWVALALLSFSLFAVAQENMPKLATRARIDINADTSVVALNDGQISGGGTIDRQTWLPTEQWPLTYTIEMPILRFAWNQFEVKFTPTHTGTLQLSLRGPWEEIISGSGVIYKQEVLWDALQADGTTIP